MLHLVAFDNPDSDTGRACLSQYRQGDVCVFADAGRLIAADFPRRGPAFLLDGDTPAPTRAAGLDSIGPDRLIELIVEHGPVTSWYP